MWELRASPLCRMQRTEVRLHGASASSEREEEKHMTPFLLYWTQQPLPGLPGP